MTKFIAGILIILLSVESYAQRTCATDELIKLNKTQEQIYKDKIALENWISLQKINRVNTNATQRLNEVTLYKIPIVVHIIHNGEPEGVGSNISDEQILSQIEALNLDFRHKNADSTNTPPLFQPLMADSGFEFELAKRDPNGLKTNGITRTDGNQSLWTFEENDEMKALSYWPANDYLNIWVAPLSAYLGWAEFPTSDLVSGVNGIAVNNPLTDGVVITSTAFGSVDIYPDGNYNETFNLGRTLTHEIGHFFGLRHIWGDGNCDVDDFITDTPNTNDSYGGCPIKGTSSKSCDGGPSMFMNYMDYVNDDCMNLFTLEQKDRMEIILNNSPRRASLLTSTALDPPPPLEIGITEIVSPEISSCSGDFTPEIKVVNNGTATISTVKVHFLVNNIIAEEQTFNLNLIENQEASLMFSPYQINEFGTSDISFEIITTNGGVDDNATNNVLGLQVVYSEVVTSLAENFNAWPDSWAIRSKAPISQWNFIKAPNLTIQNTAAVLSYYNNSSNFTDELLSPIIDLSGQNGPVLLFDYAYQYREGFEDELAIVVSTDCGINFPDTLYFSSGADISSESTPVSFTPSGTINWHTRVFDLSNYENQQIKIAFVGTSKGGNNIYLDNILLADENYQDLTIKGLLNEPGVFTDNLDKLGLVIENTGFLTISSFQIEARSDGAVVSTFNYSGSGIAPMQREIIEIDNNFSLGVHNVEFEIISTDDNSSNNSFSADISIINNAQAIPLRQKFNNSNWNEEESWTIRSIGDENEWLLSENGFLSIDNYSNGNKGLHDWLILPLLDLSQTTEAGLRYKLAYAENNLNNELLKVWLSNNNGMSFDYLLESLPGVRMATANTVFEWAPNTEEDWQTRFIDLTQFTGEEQIFIAFEVTDGDGNNVHLDDIELFVSANPDIIEIKEEVAAYPNPISGFDSRITFNLSEKQDVRVRVVDIMGNQISDQLFSNVLNQTYPLELAQQKNGIYIIQSTGMTINTAMRVLVNH